MILSDMQSVATATTRYIEKFNEVRECSADHNA